MKFTTTQGMRRLKSHALRNGLIAVGSDLIDALDPDGIHVVQHTFIHNDGQNLRSLVLCKLRDREDPIHVLVDYLGKDQDKFFSEIPSEMIDSKLLADEPSGD